MLGDHVERYLSLRSTLGYKLRETGRELRAFAKFAAARGEEFVSVETACLRADSAPSPQARSNRMRKIILFAKFMRAEDERHEVPSVLQLLHNENIKVFGVRRQGIETLYNRLIKEGA